MRPRTPRPPRRACRDLTTLAGVAADDTRVAFASTAGDLVAGDTNGSHDVFVRAPSTDLTVRASLGHGPAQLADGGYSPAMSDDARVVVSSHDAPDDRPGDTNDEDDVRTFDLIDGAGAHVGVGRSGDTGNDESYSHAVAAAGTAVAFVSDASDLVRNDTNGSADVFVRDRSIRTTPFADRATSITQQLEDVVGRTPTSAELDAWYRRLDHGEIVPEQMIDELAPAPAWAGERAPVVRLDRAFFLKTFWSMAATKDRDPEPAGLAYWKGQLDQSKKTRGDVMVGFSESAEGRLLLAPAADTVLLWLGMMRTIPPSMGWSIAGVAAVDRLGEPPEHLVRHLLADAADADRVS